MDMTAHHSIFIFIFLCRKQGKLALFSLVFPQYPSIPLSSLKRKIGKANFIGFSPFRTPALLPSGSPDGLGRPIWESFSLSAGGQAYLPGPLIKGSHKCPFCIQSHYKGPHLETFSNFREMEPGNVLVLFLAVIYINKAFKLTSRRASPRARSRKPFAPVQRAQRAQGRIFCRKLWPYRIWDSINAGELRSNYKVTPLERPFKAIWVSKAIQLCFSFACAEATIELINCCGDHLAE